MLGIRSRVEQARQQLAYRLKDLGLNKTQQGNIRFPAETLSRLHVLGLLVPYVVFHLLSRGRGRIEGKSMSYANWPQLERDHLARLLEEKTIYLSDFKQVWPVTGRIAHYLRRYDLIEAYGTDVIHAFLAKGNRPYIAYEHGTLRDYPFVDSAQGRLLSEAYKHADHVFITNPDVLPSAERLGLENYSFVPHAVDTWRYCPGDSKVADKYREAYPAALIAFAPARQNWGLKGNDILIRGFAKWFGRGGDGLLLLSDWGQTRDQSHALVEQLGIGSRVAWLPPLPKHKLIQLYRAVDVVLDQFTIGTFGGLAPEAMSCGAPVIMAFDVEKHRWCYPEMPPVINAETDEVVSSSLDMLQNQPEHRRAIGAESRAWVKKYYCNEVVAERHQEIYASLGFECGK